MGQVSPNLWVSPLAAELPIRRDRQSQASSSERSSSVFERREPRTRIDPGSRLQGHEDVYTGTKALNLLVAVVQIVSQTYLAASENGERAARMPLQTKMMIDQASPMFKQT